MLQTNKSCPVNEEFRASVHTYTPFLLKCWKLIPCLRGIHGSIFKIIHRFTGGTFRLSADAVMRIQPITEHLQFRDKESVNSVGQAMREGLGYQSINEKEFYSVEISEVNSSFAADKFMVFTVRATQQKSMPASTHPQISNHSMLTDLN